MANCVLEKQKEILQTTKYKVNLCIHYSDQQREKEQEEERREKQIDSLIDGTS